MKALIVVDMQNDFVTGALKNEQAQSIVPNVVKKIEEAEQDEDCAVIFTEDTHGDDYPSTEEGIYLPVKHCAAGTWGHEIIDELKSFVSCSEVCCKETFGSVKLGEQLCSLAAHSGAVTEIELIGVCTDICVISNALLAKAFVPNAHIKVDAACCAGVTPQSHETALDALQGCQIEVTNRGNEPWKCADQ